jgi:hypothetical protein
LKRAIATLASTILLVALLPASATAAAPTKYSEHRVFFDCETAVDGGFATFFVDRSSQFGTFSELAFWQDPAVPFEEPATVDGQTDVVDITEGASEVTVAVSYQLVDANGDPAGAGEASATLRFVGDPIPLDTFPSTNHKDRTQGTRQPIQGDARVVAPGLDAVLSGCAGELSDVKVFATNPSSFVNDVAGVTINCFWQDGDSAASFDAYRDPTALSANAFESTAEHELFGSSQSGTFTAATLDTTVSVTDSNGEPSNAHATATFTPVGGLVTSVIRGQNRQEKNVQQALKVDGTLTFDAGGTYPMDDEHCDASTFDLHVVVSAAKGPKTGPAPANDAPSGAIVLKAGAKLNVQNTGAAFDPEVPITTCPEGPRDDMGRTLWYTVVGTGGVMTFDTAGSGIDTVVGVYVRDGGGFTEVACVDDVFFDRVGTSFQAAVTGETVAGVTYYVQVGGYRDTFFGDGVPEAGRIRIAVRNGE